MAIEKGTKELTLPEAEKLCGVYGISIEEFSNAIVPQYEKYKEMILAFLKSFKLFLPNRDGKIPKTKLAKLLYLADFAWFYDHTESMSGMQYRKIDYGPVPDTFFRALDELEEAGKINIERKHDETKDRDIILISESESNHNEKITTLNSEELKLMKKIGTKWKNKKTQEIVNFTHNQLPYFLCRMDEIIPYTLIIQEDPDKVY